eukprot:scaffold544_cov66-Phaeocystis_antarctica.AAC.3
MAGRPVAWALLGSAELPRAARRALRRHRSRAWTLPRGHFETCPGALCRPGSQRYRRRAAARSEQSRRRRCKWQAAVRSAGGRPRGRWSRDARAPSGTAAAARRQRWRRRRRRRWQLWQRQPERSGCRLRVCLPRRHSGCRLGTKGRSGARRAVPRGVRHLPRTARARGVTRPPPRRAAGCVLLRYLRGGVELPEDTEDAVRVGQKALDQLVRGGLGDEVLLTNQQRVVTYRLCGIPAVSC